MVVTGDFENFTASNVIMIFSLSAHLDVVARPGSIPLSTSRQQPENNPHDRDSLSVPITFILSAMASKLSMAGLTSS